MNPVNTKPYTLPPDATWLSKLSSLNYISYSILTLIPVTGCSSGIGRAFATLIASKPSLRLIATARQPSSLSYLPSTPNILKLALDVTSPTSVDAAFTAAKDYWGDDFHLDVVVNNAGYSLSGDTESATEEQMHDEIETLFFGTVRVTMRAVGVMREDQQDGKWRGGVIFNVSSLAGLIGGFLFPCYSFKIGFAELSRDFKC